MKETGDGLPYLSLGIITLTLIQLPTMVNQSVPIARMHFHSDINSNCSLNY